MDYSMLSMSSLMFLISLVILSNASMELLVAEVVTFAGSSAIVGSICRNMDCLAVFNPVCGSNGKTYSNECELMVQTCDFPLKVHVKHRGACMDETFQKSKRLAIVCYECNSGVGIENKNCPGNGTVVDEHTEHRACDTKCFARDNTYYKGSIFRGCIADYPDLLTSPLPEDGYHGYHSGNIYICSGTMCNGKPFQPPITPPDVVGD